MTTSHEPPLLPSPNTFIQEDEQPWEQQPGEASRWYNRFRVYLSLGHVRSVREVYRREKGYIRSRAVPSSWNQIYRQFEWRRRAEAYDEHQRKIAFSDGMASDTERVKKLNELAECLYVRLKTEIDTMPVNDRLLAQYLALVDLLAKHTGGYVPQRIEHTGKDGGPIEVTEDRQVHVVFYVPEPDPIADDPTIVEQITEVVAKDEQDA